MNIQQMRYVFEVAKHHFNISEAANALYTSQPGISKQIQLLEDELGISIFVRRGKRLAGLTAPGEQVLAMIGRILMQVDSLREIADEFSHVQKGHLRIATTHMQARYVLPQVIQSFMKACPEVKLSIYQGNPVQICQAVLEGEADLAIATEAIDHYDNLVSLPSYTWNRSVVVPTGHPLLDEQPLSLQKLAQYPIITYDSSFSGRSQINRAFMQYGLKPNIVLTALDADVIKTYVALGLGVGIIAEQAFEPQYDLNLRAISAAHLFEEATTRIGLRANDYIRGYVYDFIELFAPQLTRKKIDLALQTTANS